MDSSTLMFTLLELCVSISSKRRGWRPSITVKQILVGIQDLLDQPNATDAAQTEGHQLYISAFRSSARRLRAIPSDMIFGRVCFFV
ncbi:hypothetical protein V6Z12_D08G187800 [Gossypium hirsutum]